MFSQKEKYDYKSCKKDKIEGIELNSICSKHPEELRRWSIYNPSPYWVYVHYNIENSHIKGKIICPPAGMADPEFPGDTIHNYTFLITRTIPGDNIMDIKYGNGQRLEMVSSGEKCYVDEKWSLDGNEADENSFLGTTNDQDLQIKTNDSLRMLVSKEGNVEVLQNLDVNQKVTANNLQLMGLIGMDGDMLVVDSLGNFYTRSIENDTIVFKNIQITDALSIGTHTLHLTGSPNVDPQGGSENSIYTDNGDLYIQSESDANNTILNARLNTGSVGIGTDTPDPLYKLDVDGDVNLQDRLFVNGYEIKNEPLLSGNNIALGKPIEASSECNNGYCPEQAGMEYAVDGTNETYWASAFHAAEDPSSEFLVIDLGVPQIIKKVVVKGGDNGFIGDNTSLFLTNSQSNFGTAIANNTEEIQEKTFVVDNKQARYVKVEFKNSGTTVFQIDEIEVYGEGIPALWESANTDGDIFYNGGKIGIKTATPDYTLDVHGDINYTGKLLKNGEEVNPIEQAKSDGGNLFDNASVTETTTQEGFTRKQYDLGDVYDIDKITIQWIDVTRYIDGYGVYTRFPEYNILASETDGYNSSNIVFSYNSGQQCGESLETSEDEIIFSESNKIRYIIIEYMPSPIQCNIGGAESPEINDVLISERLLSTAFDQLSARNGFSAPPLYVVDGKVGIGTQTPDASALLDVSGNTRIGGQLSVYSPLYAKDGLNITGNIMQNGELLTLDGASLWEDNNGDLFTSKDVVIGGSSSLEINKNVLGKYSYGIKLDINGNDDDVNETKSFEILSNGDPIFRIWGNGIVNVKNIYSEAFRVDPDAINLQWWDCVFNKGYKLLTLKELEEYLVENKHLPDVPSEKDIKENGVSLLDMDGLLLKKIEELTLYIIEQQKEIEDLKDIIEQLK